jgi:DNA helicase-4
MSSTWGPSRWGKRFSRSADWLLVLDFADAVFRSGGDTTLVAVGDFDELTIKTGVLWSTLQLRTPAALLEFKGMPHRSATRLQRALDLAVAEYRHELHVAGLRSAFDVTAGSVVQWASAFFDAARSHLTSAGWLTTEFTAHWASLKPGSDFHVLLTEPELADHIESQGGAVLEAIDFWRADLRQYVDAWNESHIRSEMTAEKEFFDTVERSPLTDDQVKAVVCFDNRVQVIASAGSGKTSTMVAKAGYALHKKLVPAENILLLAFNTRAAGELQQRIHNRLLPLGLDATKVTARTFHAFGVGVIGRATGKKPTLAPWLENGQDHELIMQIVDELKDSDRRFRRQWDLFRVVLGRDLPAFGEEESEPEDWDATTKAAGFRTLQGEIVRSQGERMIADWLFYNGVNYSYEIRYEHETADPTHRQYQPDFYYPDINAYHEHWALDEHGQPPAEFVGYLDGVAWKRDLHARHGTTLLETTMSGVWDGTAFDYLTEQLTRRGIVLDPNPDRPVPGTQPIENDELVRTIRTFLTHAKSNQLDDTELRERLSTRPGGRFRFRHSLFLDLFQAIRRAWESRLAASAYIDFEDMLNQAAEHIESGRWESPFELVMVDEMQDASYARARLARALVAQPGRHLFAVGDDWQSINRFAGADLTVMTEFERWFGEGETLRLERTFRSPQSLCDVSSAFIQQNPTQLPKQVVSSTREYTPTIRAVSVARDTEYASVISAELNQLNQDIRSGALPSPAAGKVTVAILGRYNHHQTQLPVPLNQWDRLDVRFMTIHGSKGAEADYVIIPGLTTGSFGFPSRIIDDPVLRLAMPQGDPFPLAEERRLFYVAMTRARRAVLLLTIQKRESPFLLELIRDHGIPLSTANGETIDATVCPKCNRGFMVERSGPRGRFLSCNRFPRCKSTMNALTTN